MNLIKQGKTNWKYIGIVIVLALLTTGAIFIYQKDMIQEMTSLLRFSEIKKPEELEDETADWKTYTNEEYGFEIKHPEDWTAEEFSKGQISFLHPPLAEEFPDVQDVMIQIKILENPEKLSITQWLANKIEGEIIVPVKEISDFTINNIMGKRLREVEYIPTEGFEEGEVLTMRFEHESVYLSKDNLIYNISVATGSPQLFFDFNQMLSTFRFLEKEEPYIKVISPNEGEWEVSEAGIAKPLIFTNLTTGETKEFSIIELLSDEMKEELVSFTKMMMALEEDEEPPYLLLGNTMTDPLKWSTDFKEFWGALYWLGTGDPGIPVLASVFKINMASWKTEKFMIPRWGIGGISPQALNLKPEKVLYETTSEEGNLLLCVFDFRLQKERVITSYPKEAFNKYFKEFWKYVGDVDECRYGAPEKTKRCLHPKWLDENTISYLDFETREEIIKRIDN